MPIDARREQRHIWSEYKRFSAQIGEEIIWFKFDVDGSSYDDIYDEGGKGYLPAIRCMALWVDQIEDPEQYSGEGRRPTQRIRFAVSGEELQLRGISTYETHGAEIGGLKPAAPYPPQPGRDAAPWLDDRLNDVIFYDNRFYSVSNFQIRGRLKNRDVIIGVAALELKPEDESVFDFFPLGTKTMDVLDDQSNAENLDIYVRYLDLNTPQHVTLQFGVELEGTWTATASNEDGQVAIPITVSGTDIEMDISSFVSGFPWNWELRQRTPSGQSLLVYRGKIYEVVQVDDDDQETEELDIFIEVDTQSTVDLEFRDPDTDALLDLDGEWDAYIESYTGVWAVPVDSTDQDNGVITLDFTELESQLPAAWWLVQTAPTSQTFTVYEGTVYLIEQEQ